MPDQSKRTILIYSPDMNFCFSLSSLFQDRYNVITSTDPELLDPERTISAAHLVIIDEEPSEKMMERVKRLRTARAELPVIMLYVFRPQAMELDQAVKDLVNGVFYKPLNVRDVSHSIEELIGV
ncbi:MAG: hypothetical protein OEV30_02455 [Ignavibacteria bacterium]|nr:hypothetical protein [Ignavibacteria bacterium]